MTLNICLSIFPPTPPFIRPVNEKEGNEDIKLIVVQQRGSPTALAVSTCGRCVRLRLITVPHMYVPVNGAVISQLS